MSKTVSVLTIIFVTATVSESQQILNLLNTNFNKLFGIKGENDAQNNRNLDEVSGRDQGNRQLKSNPAALPDVNDPPHGLENRIQQDLQYNRNEPRSSLLQSQIQRPEQTLHVYNTNIFFPEIIARLENNTSAYSEIARKRHPNPSKTDDSLRADGIPRLYHEPDPMETGIKHVYIESDESLRTRKPLDINSQEPGDGEGWYNYPITPIAGPNPAWHMSTLRRIYQRPHRIVKRSPKRKSKKKKKTRDETKKFNKKKKTRRKMRILKSRKDKPKKKKGDGSYRGGRGRKPRMHRKPGNMTLSSTENVTDYYTEESETDEGPVADAYIDYDSSYVPPSKEQEFSDDKYVIKPTPEKIYPRSKGTESKSDEDKDTSESDGSKSKSSNESSKSSSKSDKKKKKKVKPRRMKVLRKKRPKNKKKKTIGKTGVRQYHAQDNDKNHFILRRRESFNLTPNRHKSKLIAQKTKPHTIVETIINQLKIQQLQKYAKDDDFQASILLHPLDGDVPQSNIKVKQTSVHSNRRNMMHQLPINNNIFNLAEVGKRIVNDQGKRKAKSDILSNLIQSTNNRIVEDRHKRKDKKNPIAFKQTQNRPIIRT